MLVIGDVKCIIVIQITWPVHNLIIHGMNYGHLLLLNKAIKLWFSGIDQIYCSCVRTFAELSPVIMGSRSQANKVITK